MYSYSCPLFGSHVYLIFFNIIILVAGGQPKVEGDQGEPGEALQELGRQKNEMRNAPSMTSST